MMFIKQQNPNYSGSRSIFPYSVNPIWGHGWTLTSVAGYDWFLPPRPPFAAMLVEDWCPLPRRSINYSKPTSRVNNSRSPWLVQSTSLLQTPWDQMVHLTRSVCMTRVHHLRSSYLLTPCHIEGFHLSENSPIVSDPFDVVASAIRVAMTCALDWPAYSPCMVAAHATAAVTLVLTWPRISLEREVNR